MRIFALGKLREQQIAQSAVYELHRHKEGPLINEALITLQDIVAEEIVVIGGIHYDDIQPWQIAKILNHGAILLERVREFLINRYSS